MRGSLFGFVLLLLAPLGSAAQAKPALDQILAKMGEVGRKFQSLDASIERTKVTVIVNDRSVDFGRVYFVRTGSESRLKVDILKPEVQKLLVEKQQAWLYLPKINQVQLINLGKSQDKAEFLLVGFGQSTDDIRKYYNVSHVGEETIGGVETSVIDLKPKSAQASAMFSSIRLWLDQTRWIPVQSRMNEAGGDYLLIKFSNIKLNARIPGSVFDLKLPKNVQKVVM